MNKIKNRNFNENETKYWRNIAFNMLDTTNVIEKYIGNNPSTSVQKAIEYFDKVGFLISEHAKNELSFYPRNISGKPNYPLTTDEAILLGSVIVINHHIVGYRCREWIFLDNEEKLFLHMKIKKMGRDGFREWNKSNYIKITEKDYDLIENYNNYPVISITDLFNITLRYFKRDGWALQGDTKPVCDVWGAMKVIGANEYRLVFNYDKKKQQLVHDIRLKIKDEEIIGTFTLGSLLHVGSRVWDIMQYNKIEEHIELLFSQVNIAINILEEVVKDS